MRLTLKTVINGHDILIEGGNVDEICTAAQRFSEKMPKAKAAPVIAGSNSKGTPEDMMDWLRSEERNHSKTWIGKYSGFSNSATLLTGLTAKGIIEWRELLYETKTLRLKTMSAAFVDGDKPPRNTLERDREILLEYVRDNPGQSTKRVETYCGVVKSCATDALNHLLKKAEVEMRPDPEDSSCFKVWAVE